MCMGNKPSSHVHSKFQGRVEYQEPKTEFPGVRRRGSRQKTLVVGILITSRNNTVWCLLININVRVSLTLTFINYFSSDIARRNIPILFFANKSDCKEALTAVQVGYKLRNTSNRLNEYPKLVSDPFSLWGALAENYSLSSALKSPAILDLDDLDWTWWIQLSLLITTCRHVS